MMWAVYLNGTDLATIESYTMDVGGWLSAPTRDYPTVAIPGRQGVVFAGDPTMAPRTLRLTGVINPSSRTVASRLADEKLMKSLAYQALATIITDDDVNAPIAIDGVCTSCEIVPRGHPLVATLSGVTLTFMCLDPTWRDVTAQVVGFNSTPATVPTGTAPAGGIVRIAAPSWSASVTNPVLTYYNAATVSLQAMTFTGLTLTAGTDYLEIDLDRATATKYSSGTGSNAISYLASGDFFAIDPMDGDPLNSSYPLLGCSGTAGTPSGIYLGSRRWL